MAAAGLLGPDLVLYAFAALCPPPPPLLLLPCCILQSPLCNQRHRTRTPDILFLKHDRNIFRQPSNPVCSFSLGYTQTLCCLTHRDLFWLFLESHTGIGARMSCRKWRENKQQLIRWPELVLLGLCLVSLHFRRNILAPIPVQGWNVG